MQLAPVAPRETIPAIGLALAVMVIGLVPGTLGRLSETAATALSSWSIGVG